MASDQSFNELITKLCELNRSINGREKLIRIKNLINELIESLEIIEDCIDNCKEKLINDDEIINLIYESMGKLRDLKNQEDQEKVYIYELNNGLTEINNRNKKVLCDNCKKKKIEKLTEKCENIEIAELIYESELGRLNAIYRDNIEWIPFNEFKDIKYLAKGGFGEVHKAIWIDFGYDSINEEYKEINVVLKRLYNSRDKILDILKEVKKFFITLIITIKS